MGDGIYGYSVALGGCIGSSSSQTHNQCSFAFSIGIWIDMCEINDKK